MKERIIKAIKRDAEPDEFETLLVEVSNFVT